jgi:hypothetical protein
MNNESKCSIGGFGRWLVLVVMVGLVILQYRAWTTNSMLSVLSSIVVTTASDSLGSKPQCEKGVIYRPAGIATPCKTRNDYVALLEKNGLTDGE